LTPLVRLNLDLADGRSVEKLATYEPEAWSAATDGADVRIGGNRFSGDLHRYRITVSIDEIEVLSCPARLLAAGLAAITFVRGALAPQTSIRGILGRIRFSR
jgi:hypothetical protein